MSREKRFVNTFNGHIVNCKDLDSGDQFNVEVLINHNLPDDRLIKEACDAASKTEMAKMSGNKFEFEYVQPSGKVMKRTIIKEILSETNTESAELLEKHEIF